MALGATLGLAREATVLSFSRGVLRVRLILSEADIEQGIENEVEVPCPGWFGRNGEVVAGIPPKFSTIWVALAQGGRWASMSMAPSDDSFNDGKLSVLREGRYVIQVQNDIGAVFGNKLGIKLGDPSEFLHLDPIREISINSFKNNYIFTEASRDVSGIIKRDLRSNSKRIFVGGKDSQSFDNFLDPVGLDPGTNPGELSARNPPLTESRQLYYEFAESFGFDNDENEKDRYDSGKIPEVSIDAIRRESRADTLSLNLIEPNHLLEKIIGTVVDIYGNILDINRIILPSGGSDELSLRSSDTNQSDVFTKLREDQRKSVAYHMEINSRKPPEDRLGLGKTKDYSRDRSRFSVDIDKEGQFKINVSSSSETGNISLLSRYENFSTLEAYKNDGNLKGFARNVQGDHQDIYLEGYGQQSIDIKESVPAIDWHTKSPIKLGTAFHDITNTVELHQRNDLLSSYYSDSKLMDIPLVTNIVSSEIIASGENANAGGRSGTISLDGHLSMSIGANSIDRQSLWLDCAGSIISNIGRDNNNISYAATLDGDMLIQIGGTNVTGDSRFTSNNASRPGALDIRVAGGRGDNATGVMTIIRVDSSGVRIITPGEVDITSEGNMRLRANRGKMMLDAEEGVFIDGRWVQKGAGTIK